ncbi:MAG: beta strand repeat-containing protein, partial [Limisphaerales bacterium]
MSLAILIALVAAGVVLWPLNTSVSIEAPIKKLLNFAALLTLGLTQGALGASGTLFTDSFPGSGVAPFAVESGKWTVANGVLSGTSPVNGYGYAYYSASGWGNYTVQANICFSITNGSWGGGLGGQLNATTGAHYGAWVYPEGSGGGSAMLKLIKFQGWTSWSGTPMASANLTKGVGTNWHTVAVTFQGANITVSYDGTQVISVTDNNFGGVAPFTTGGISVDMATDPTAYTLGVSNVVVTAVSTPPVANNDSYSALQGTTLMVAAPGVLANDTGGSGPLTAQWVSGTASGSLTLNTNGSFTYTPNTGFAGTDSFTYAATDGVNISPPATVTITVTSSSGVLLSDTFPGTSLSPFVQESGTWTVANHVLSGTCAVNTYGHLYVTTNWTNYSVQAQVQFPSGAFGGGIGGRLNASNGAHYGVWVYPEGSAGGSAVMKLMKFTGWTTWSGTPMATASLTTGVGTAWHTLLVTFQGSTITAFFDGTQEISVTDNSFGSVAPYADGGITVDMSAYPSTYTMSASNVVVNATGSTAPGIVTQPVSQGVAAGANVSFSVTASGTPPLSYQWQFNGANLSGATTSSLTLTNVQTANAGSYTVVVTNSAGSVSSAAAVLTVLTAPAIVTEPVGQSVLAGANVNFNVTASGTPPLGYQWQFNGANLSGATASSLTLTSVQTANAGSYTVEVTNSAGSVSSAAAVLTVLTAPAVVSQPVSQTVGAGANVSFSVAASGTPPLSYQWQFNGANLSGATGSSLTLTSVQTANAGSYTVEVTNSAGSVSSAAAVLTVLTAPAIVSQPVSQTVAAGANVSFSVTASGAAPLSYQWQFNGANLSGATTGSLTLTSVQTADAGSYTVVVSNSFGSVTSAAAVLTLLIPPAIVTQPASQSVTAGANVGFSVTASGTAPLSYQWQFNGANLSGATGSNFTLTSVQTPNAGNYVVVVTNLAGSVTSAAALLTVLTPPAIVTQPVSQSVATDANVGFSVTASGTPPLSYQWQFNGAALSGATTNSLTLTSVQTASAGSYAVVVTNSAGSVTSAAAVLTVVTAPAIVTQPASQSVAAGANVGFSVTTSGTAPLSYQWQFNGAALSAATTSSLALTGVQTPNAGNYTVVVTNLAGSVTSAAAVLTVLTPPAIVTQPVSQTVAAGSNVTFSVAASGTPPLSYQWLFNGAALSAATSSSLALSGVQTANAGSYNVVVTNSFGSLTSAAAALTVLIAPAIITQPASQTVVAGSNVSFSVTAFGTAPLRYQWRFNGTALSAATSSSLALTAVRTANAGSYTVFVTNSAASVTSAAAVLTVLPAPAITINGGLTYQVIDGFGVNANHRSWNNNELQPVLDALIDQGGMTLFHVI